MVLNQDEFLVLWEAFPKSLDGTKKDRVLRFLLHIKKVSTQCSVCLEMSGHGLWIIYALKAFIYEYGEVRRGDCYKSDSPTQSKPVNVQFKIGSATFIFSWVYNNIIVLFLLSSRSHQKYQKNLSLESKRFFGCIVLTLLLLQKLELCCSFEMLQSL